MTPTNGITTDSETNPRIRAHVDEVMRHARRTFRHSVPAEGPSDGLDDGSLHGQTPWVVTSRSRPLWSPASWFSTLAVAGAVPLAIVYWMLN